MKVKVDCQHKIFLPDVGMYVGCGRCAVCRQKRSNSWFVRLWHEQKYSLSSLFFTLTYNNEHLPTKEITCLTDGGDRYFELDDPHFRGSSGDCRKVTMSVPTFEPNDVKKFIKLIRFELGSRCAVKYFIIGEYCPTTYRPHYHGILFNFPREYWHLLDKYWSSKYGFIKTSPVCTDNHIRYVSKYCTQSTALPSLYNLKQLRFRTMASHGLGLSYIENAEVFQYHKDTLSCQVKIGGYDYALPRYYRDKIFDEEEKEVIRNVAIEADKQYRAWYKSKFFDTGYDTSYPQVRRRYLEVYDAFMKKVKDKSKKRKIHESV